MKSLALLLPVLAFAVALTVQLVPTTPGESLGLAAPVAEVEMDSTSAGLPEPSLMANGARVYRVLCAACHMPDGRGVPGVIPPLAGADYLLEDRPRAVRIILQGLSGPVTVNGASYNNLMPPLDAVLSDTQVADVLTYVTNSWGNTGDAFDPDFVSRVRPQPR